MSARARWSVASRVTAAILGSAVLALAAAVALALTVPHPRTLGTALAVTLAVPFWVTAMCAGFLARSSWRAWAGYLGATALLALWIWLRR